MRIYNSLSRRVEEFRPINPPGVGMYTCGQTVYDYTHIGHGRKYTNDDILRRTLTYLGYDVMHVQNVTDVGHLVSDSDEGEDKLEKGARKFGKTVWEVAEFFTKHFYNSLDRLNILRPTVICKATDHIPEQIEMIKKLLEKGYAYETESAIYFDVAKFSDYGKLFGQALAEKKEAVRDEVVADSSKHQPADFALWFKLIGRFSEHQMHWSSPWGEGFPGWHIECSAMSVKYLGEQFDIHTGGEDHLAVHHPNEIAQSEAATGKKPFVKYWVHHAFLMVEGRKVSKSLGNLILVEEVVERKIEPLALRYLFLTTHYRKQMNFTWEALAGAQKALSRLRNLAADWGEAKIGCAGYEGRFAAALEDDLNMPEALAIVWELVKSDYPGSAKKASLSKFDRVLGLGLTEGNQQRMEMSEEVKVLLEKRERLRQVKKFDEADLIRGQIEDLGYSVEDKSLHTPGV